MSFCERVGEWAAGLRAADLPNDVAERARLQSLSVEAATRAGSDAAAPLAAAAPDGPVGEVYRGAAASIDLRELARRRDVRRELRRAIARGGPTGIGGLDASAMRLTFPCRLRIRLRDGRTIDAEGDERGGGGRPLSEQRAVVEAKAGLVGLSPALASGR